MELKVIARMKSDFPAKFGLPRQSGLVEGIVGRVVFEKEYAVKEALKGLEGYSHIWLIWGFSEAMRESWSPTVRPPRLGGNRKIGVFATRSPYRPNSLGLSCVRLLAIEDGALRVDGADLMDGTPIYDIKPYLPFTDSIPDAADGFAGTVREDKLKVVTDDRWLSLVPKDKREALIKILRADPRPAYHNDDARIYGFGFAGLEVRFSVKDGTLTVCEITKTKL